MALDWAEAAARAFEGTRHDYTVGLRPEQKPPDTAWLIWLIMTGRGFGKTHAGSRWLLGEATANPGDYAIIAPTFTDVRKICVEGPSGIIAAAAPGDVDRYNRSTWQITLANGSVIHMLSADQPDRVRGYNLSGAWCDELAAWRYDAAWYDGLIPALRIGDRPRVVVTTTPRSTRLMRDLAGRDDDTIAITRGSTWANVANLSQVALAEFARWEGTARGRQELHGELLDDVPGAHWRRHWIEDNRATATPDRLRRVVVGVDPSGTDREGADECGIIAAGIAHDGHVYVLDDASRVASPDGWARIVADAYDRHAADRVVAERNFGADMVTATLRHVRSSLPVKTVTASRGKAVRAEPVAALYEQGRVHHVGAFPELEDQMCTWDAASAESPDRMDALVWAITELVDVATVTGFLHQLAPPCDQCGTPIPPSEPDCPTCRASQAQPLNLTEGVLS